MVQISPHPPPSAAVGRLRPPPASRPRLSWSRSHSASRNQLWEVPEGAKVLASSDKTGVEMFCVDEHVLGIQRHPEYTKDILLSLVDRLLAAGSITDPFAEAVKRQEEITAPDREFWLTLCKSFLRA